MDGFDFCWLIGCLVVGFAVLYGVLVALAALGA